jgi:hypothetical protein
MIELPIFSLDEISQRLKSNSLPLSGITESGSTEFHIREPAHYIGMALHAGHRVRALALEYKKLFMDEWSGVLYDDKLELLISNFKETVEIVNSL